MMSLGIRVWFLIKADEVEREGGHATVLATSHPHLQVPLEKVALLLFITCVTTVCLFLPDQLLSVVPVPGTQ